MATNFQITNTVSGCTTAQYAAATIYSSSTNSLNRRAEVGGSAGTALTNTVSIGASGSADADQIGIAHELYQAQNYFWEGGTWTVRIRVTLFGNTNMAWTGLYVVSMKPDCTLRTILASDLTFSHTLTAGTKTQTISVPRFAPYPGDSLAVLGRISNIGAGGATSCTMANDQIIDTPFTSETARFIGPGGVVRPIGNRSMVVG